MALGPSICITLLKKKKENINEKSKQALIYLNQIKIQEKNYRIKEGYHKKAKEKKKPYREQNGGWLSNRGLVTKKERERKWTKTVL